MLPCKSTLANLITDSDAVDLLSFTIDLDTGTLDLTFDDTVSTNSSFDPAGIVIQNANIAENITASHQLTTGTYTVTPDGYYLTIILSQFDLNIIKNNLQLASDINSTFLRTRESPNNPVTDTFLNPLTPIFGLQASEFTPDVSMPPLVSYILNLNEGRLLLTFNETVRAETLNITNIVLGSGANFSSSNFVYQLTGGNSSQTDSTSIIVQFSVEDLNELKRITPGLATTTADTYLAFSNETILDLNENPVVEIEN